MADRRETTNGAPATIESLLRQIPVGMTVICRIGAPDASHNFPISVAAPEKMPAVMLAAAAQRMVELAQRNAQGCPCPSCREALPSLAKLTRLFAQEITEDAFPEVAGHA